MCVSCMSVRLSNLAHSVCLSKTTDENWNSCLLDEKAKLFFKVEPQLFSQQLLLAKHSSSLFSFSFVVVTT